MRWVEMQRAFAEALPDTAAATPGFLTSAGGAPARRFAVYRNNHIAGLVDALAESYPVVRRLVGDDFFRAMAADYVRRHPPRSPVLMGYGVDFAGFIDGFSPARTLGYLPDTARLEWLMTESLQAADAAPLTIAALQALPPDALPALRMIAHPAARFLASDWPVVSIWRAHQPTNDSVLMLGDDGAENAIIVRPDMTVYLHDAEPGAFEFLAALAGGARLGDAAERIAGDGEAALPWLLQAAFAMGLVAGLDSTTTTTTIGGTHDPKPDRPA